MSSRHRMAWYNANALIVLTLFCGGPHDCTACIPRTSRRERHETPGARRPNDARGHTRTGRHAMACAHHRDHIPASDNMSSPSAGAGRGAGPLPARGQPRGSARCAPALWSLRRGAASRPASRHVVVRYPSRRARVGCPAATRAGQPLALRSRRGDGRGRWHRPWAFPVPPRGSRGDTPSSRARAQPLARYLYLSMSRKEYWCVSCRKGAPDETASPVCDHPDPCGHTRQRYAPGYLDTHDHTSSIQVCVLRPGARTRHGCGSPALAVQHLVLCLGADHGYRCSVERSSPSLATVPQ